MELARGQLRQFDVEVDGQILKLPKKSFWMRFLTGPWPDEQMVIELLRQRLPHDPARS